MVIHKPSKENYTKMLSVQVVNISGRCNKCSGRCTTVKG